MSSGDSDPRVAQGQGALEQVFGERLVSLALVGGALDPSRPDRMVAPELLAVVRDANTADLTALAARAGRAMKKGLRVRVLTAEELRTSTDAFALEAAEWRARHALLAGEDLLAHLEVDAAHLRLAIERRLRGLGRRLRNQVLARLATRDRLARGHRGDVGAAVNEAQNALVVIAHHALLLDAADTPVPTGRWELLRALADRAGVDTSVIATWSAAFDDVGHVTKPLDAVDALLPVIDAAAAWVDQLEVA